MYGSDGGSCLWLSTCVEEIGWGILETVQYRNTGLK